MRAKKRNPKLTERRKVFLQAVDILKKHVDADGHLVGFYMPEDLLALCSRCKHSGSDAAALAICSALYAMSLPESLRDIDEISERCLGAELFKVAYRLGRLDVLHKHVFKPVKKAEKTSRKAQNRKARAR